MPAVPLRAGLASIPGTLGVLIAEHGEEARVEVGVVGRIRWEGGDEPAMGGTEGVVRQRGQEMVEGMITQPDGKEILRVPRAGDVGRIEKLGLVVKAVAFRRKAMGGEGA